MTPRFLVGLWKALAGSHSRVTHPAYPLPPQHRGFPAPLQTEPGAAVSQVLGRKGLLLAHLPNNLWGAQEEELAFLPEWDHGPGTG